MEFKSKNKIRNSVMVPKIKVMPCHKKKEIPEVIVHEGSTSKISLEEDI